MNPESSTPDAIHYFVDEAGDPTLFSDKGKILIGTEGCSKYFILGKLQIDDAPALAKVLNELRAQLLADPYFKAVPSMQLAAGKTALAFHAKDDTAEVRREVFKLLLQHEVRFYAVVRDKRDLLSYVQQQEKIDPNYHYRQNDLYDLLVKELFSKFHGIAEHFHICFAERGTKDRTKALELAIKKANAVFEESFGFMNPGACHVTSGTPQAHAALQAVDYYLWALQRFYERDEYRYVELIWPQTVEVQDMDFIDNGKRGVFYRKEKPLHLAGRIKKSGI